MTIRTAAVFIAVAASAAGAGLDQITNPRRRDGTWVTDMAGVMKPRTIAAVNQIISALERANGTEVAVVTIPDTDGRDPKPFATALANRWGIGKAGIDNGVLFLVVMNRRRMEVEVGEGARAFMPDARVAEILRTSVVPHFKRGDADAGILAGVQALNRELRAVDYRRPPPRKDLVTPPPLRAPPPRSGGVYPAVPPAADKGSFGWGWIAGGSGVVALLGFGIRAGLRRRPRSCSSCQSRMVRLDERADDDRLSPAQRVEEYLSSVDYDVWTCPSCNGERIEAYRAWLSSFSDCPQCGARTVKTTSTTMESATKYSEGRGRRERDCQHCRWHDSQEYTIARVVETSSSSSSSFSSSSSGRSSFGGGSSSGGGSGSSW